ncbi:hypothetical protein SDJN02_14461, partial [Cucurbita argyrosperma subsp. argyrosperma]
MNSTKLITRTKKILIFRENVSERKIPCSLNLCDYTLYLDSRILGSSDSIFPVPIALISLSPCCLAYHGDDSSSFTGVLRRNILHPSEHRWADKHTGSSSAMKISIKRRFTDGSQ